MIHNSIFGKAKTYIMGSGRIYETKERPMDEQKEEPNKKGRPNIHGPPKQPRPRGKPNKFKQPKDPKKRLRP